MPKENLFGQRIKQLVEVLGIGQNGLAEAIDANRSVVSRWIQGHSIPTKTSLLRIAKATGCNSDWLLTGEGPIKIGEGNPPSSLSFVDEIQRDNVLLEEVRAAVESFPDQLKKHDLVMEEMSEDMKMKWIIFCYKILKKEDAAGIPRGTVEEEVHRQMGSLLL
ncbi:MAG: helix-turn-helix domain-containing protein [Desulfobulbia bacterium]